MLKSFDDLKYSIYDMMYNKRYTSIFDLNNNDLMDEILKMDKKLQVSLSGLNATVKRNSIEIYLHYIPNYELGKKYNIHTMIIDKDEWKKFIRIKKLDQI